MSSVHSAAQQGFSAEAQRYAQGRPEYPEALSDWLRDALGLRPQTVAVDLGAGTGKFTRLLARTGARVVAVEPVDAMRAQLAEALPQVQALAGSAQSIPLANGFADALVRTGLSLVRHRGGAGGNAPRADGGRQAGAGVERA